MRGRLELLPSLAIGSSGGSDRCQTQKKRRPCPHRDGSLTSKSRSRIAFPMRRQIPIQTKTTSRLMASHQRSKPGQRNRLSLGKQMGCRREPPWAGWHCMAMDGRREARRRVLKRATIITGANNSELPCSIKNQSSDGAELVLSPELHVPESFTLYVPLDGVAYECRRRWRKEDRVGVEFIGRASKPARHYG